MTTASFSFSIEGMHCNACVRRVNNALSALPSVVLTELAVGKAQGHYDPASIELASIEKAVSDAGYSLAVVGPAHE